MNHFKNPAQWFCLLLCCCISYTQAQRNGPIGSTTKNLGPASATAVEAQRSSKGANAESEVVVTGPNGKGATVSGSSRVLAGKGSGNATVTTNSGKSATASGQGQVTATSVTGNGNVSTSSGKTASGSGSVNKTTDGAQATGSVSTGSGKTSSGTIDANATNSSATVTTARGSKTVQRNKPN